MFDRAAIFRLAWANAKTAASMWGGASAKERFPASLRGAWAGAKRRAEFEAINAARIAKLQERFDTAPLAHLDPQLNPIRAAGIARLNSAHLNGFSTRFAGC